jgi:hypothetical protein
MIVRRAGVVSVIVLTGLALIAGLANAVAPRWAKQVGLDIWNLPDLRAASLETESRRVELQEQAEQINHEIEAAEHVATRLIDATMTLSQAIDDLEPSLRNRAGFEIMRQQHNPVPTFRQAVARYAIFKVERRLQHDPSRWMPVSARLEAEYAAIE